MTNFLGIDYGKTRIGLAVSTSGKIASPLKTIINRGGIKTMIEVDEILKSQFGQDYPRCCSVICGLPLDAGGQETLMSCDVRAFGAMIAKGLGVNVEFQNEYLTSHEAEQYIRNVMGVTKLDKVKELLDSVSAKMILQEYLDARN